jgi:repressor LexA
LSIQHNDNQDQVVDIKPSLLQPQQSQSNTTDNKEWSESLNEVPLIGNVAAGTGVLALENLEETIPLPELFTGKGKVFMLRVRGDSMIESGIFAGDYVVVRQQPTALEGEIVVAGIPQEEATVKFFATTDKSAGMNSKVVLKPANSSMDPITLDPRDVTIYGKVVSVLRKLS